MEWSKERAMSFRKLWSQCSVAGLLLAMIAHSSSAADPSLPDREVLVVIGAPGETEYANVFRSWADRWRQVFGTDPRTAFQLIDGTDTTTVGATVHRQQILDWIERKPTSAPESPMPERWLVLIGHGTHDRSGAKFNLRGPDLTAEAIAKSIAKVNAKWLIVAGSSSSGPFLTALSGKDRVVITATKNGAEQNYARFGDFLSQTISDPSSDLDHDECVSILEAFLAASSRVAQFYENEDRLASEQALLDDNGDGRGTPAAFYRGARPVKAPADGLKLDGTLAGRWIISRFGKSKHGTSEPRSAEQLARRLELEAELDGLRSKKIELGEDAYYAELERLFLELAK